MASHRVRATARLALRCSPEPWRCSPKSGSVREPERADSGGPQLCCLGHDRVDLGNTGTCRAEPMLCAQQRFGPRGKPSLAAMLMLTVRVILLTCPCAVHAAKVTALLCPTFVSCILSLKVLAPFRIILAIALVSSSVAAGAKLSSHSTEDPPLWTRPRVWVGFQRHQLACGLRSTSTTAKPPACAR